MIKNKYFLLLKTGLITKQVLGKRGEFITINGKRDVLNLGKPFKTKQDTIDASQKLNSKCPNWLGFSSEAGVFKI